MKLVSASMLIVFATAAMLPAALSAQPKAIAPAGSPKEITFGMISTTAAGASADDYKKRWQPLLDELATQTGVRVNVLASTNIVEDIRVGKIHVAWLSNKLALDAVGTGKMKVFSQMVKEDGTAGYSSVLLVRRESPIITTEDLFKAPGTYKLGYGATDSTSGYLMPNIFLFKIAKIAKIDPVKHFKSVVNQGPRANFLAVANKEVDVAVNNTEDMAIFQKELPEKFKDVRIIWTSQPLPDHPILVSRELPDALRVKIEEFFLKYGADKGNQGQVATLKKIRGLSGFRKSDNTQLKAVSILEMHNEIGKVEGNGALSADEKKQRMADISIKMQKLNTLISTPQ